MLAAAQADMDSLHQLLIADPTLVNRKDFIQVSVQGYVSYTLLCGMCALNVYLFTPFLSSPRSPSPPLPIPLSLSAPYSLDTTTGSKSLHIFHELGIHVLILVKFKVYCSFPTCISLFLVSMETTYSM